VFVPTARTFDAALAEQRRTEAEFQGVTQSPARQAIAAASGDVTGAMNPYERSKVHIAYGYGLTGAGMRIGIVDDGFNLDGDNPAHGEFTATNKIVRITNSDPIGSQSHGVHVSALATADRNGTAMHGVAYNAQLFLGISPTNGAGFKAVFDEFRTSGVHVSSNSYGVPVQGDADSPWRPVRTSEDGFEVTARNFLAYRDAQNLTTTQAMANVFGGTAAEWSDALASFRAFQDSGGVVVWANSNYGPNEPQNGLDEVDSFAALPLLAPEVSGGWITVTNATSIGLATQELGAEAVAAGTRKEGGIYLFSAKCGAAAAFCLSHDGVAMWSASNMGNTSYESQSGTSQATPQVAGMLALLREAFPTVSAADLAARLLFTADNAFFVNDANTPTGETETTVTYTTANGSISKVVSSIWGHGFADMQRALNPVGATATVTRRGRRVDLSRVNGAITMGAMFGRGTMSSESSRFVYTDVLNGVFLGDAASFVSVTPDRTFEQTFGQSVINNSLMTARSESGLTVQAAQVIVPDSTVNGFRPDQMLMISQTLAPDFEMAVGWGVSADQRLGFAPNHAALRAASVTDRRMGLAPLSIMGQGQAWASGRYETGGLQVTGVVVASRERQQVNGLQILNGEDRKANTGVITEARYAISPKLDLMLTVGMIEERGGFLGSFAMAGDFLGEAASGFVGVGSQMRLSDKVSLTGTYQRLQSRVRADDPNSLIDASTIAADSFAVNLDLRDFVLPGSVVTLGVSQPLRVASGGLSLTLPDQLIVNGPSDYSFGFSGTPQLGGPGGRQLDFALEWTQQIGANVRAGMAGIVTRDAGHIADAPTAFGGMVTVNIRM
jgi:hypothetical protein